MSSAATVESTPPLRPQTTRPSPTCARIFSTVSSHERRHRPVAGAAADVEGEVAQDLGAVIGVRDFRDGTAARRTGAPSSAIAATGAFALVAVDRETRAARSSTKSPWLAQTRSSAGTPTQAAARLVGDR